MGQISMKTHRPPGSNLNGNLHLRANTRKITSYLPKSTPNLANTIISIPLKTRPFQRVQDFSRTTGYVEMLRRLALAHAARSRTSPPLPRSNFALPFSATPEIGAKWPKG
jgi:hypothetical protein